MAAGKHVSQDPMDFVSLILYVRRGVPACEELVQLAALHLDVLIQDVDALQCAKPAWLRGVPTAVILPSYSVLTGTQAMAAVREKCANGIQALAGNDAVQAAAISGGDVPKPAGFAPLFLCEDDPAPDAVLALPPAGADARYQDRPREKQNATSLEEMMRLRGSSEAHGATS